MKGRGNPGGGLLKDLEYHKWNLSWLMNRGATPFPSPNPLQKGLMHEAVGRFARPMLTTLPGPHQTPLL